MTIGPESAARSYLARGWSVIPMEARAKRPLVRWQEFQSRHALPDVISRWFQRWPEANVGIVTGAISRLVVMDVDRQHGGLSSLALLEMEHGSLPATVAALTGGGGRHYYFAHPGDVIHNRTGLAPGIDIRGDGGCVVAPPSIHPSGGRYAWVPGCSPDDVQPANLPGWLRDLATTKSMQGHSRSHWRDLVQGGVAIGARNSTIASLAGHLLWHEVDPAVVTELLLAWNRVRCRPPLGDEEVLRTVASIISHHRENNVGRVA